MNKFQKTLTSAIVAGTLLISASMPLFASTDIVITGNGTSSDNTSNVTVTQTTSVQQSNNADVKNNVDSNASSGGNEVKGNTGGNVSVDTGSAQSHTTVANTLNSNTANVACCQAQDTNVTISGNGSDTKNTANVTLGPSGNNASDLIDQSNSADVKNDVNSNASTGYNKASDNTGGSVHIDTGNATTGVVLSTVANANSATIGGGNSGSGSLTALITGNGTESDNNIDLTLGNSVWFAQSNNANVDNDVNANAKSGGNEAKDNTGGSADITTGNATTTVAADTATNFNWADSDCGCLLQDVLAKVANNGSDTNNTLTASLDNVLGVTQSNCQEEHGLLLFDFPWNYGNHCGVNNNVDANAKTGDNTLKDSTGNPGSDPSVDTGNSSSTVDLSNSGNANVYGAMPSELSWPDLGNLNLQFSFNLNDLLSWLMSH